MSIIFFALAAMWCGWAWYDFGQNGANYEFWVDLIIAALCFVFAIESVKGE